MFKTIGNHLILYELNEYLRRNFNVFAIVKLFFQFYSGLVVVVVSDYCKGGLYSFVILEYLWHSSSYSFKTTLSPQIMFSRVIRGSDAFRVAWEGWWGGCSDGELTKWQKSELRHKTKSSVCRAIFEAICPQRIPKPQQGPYLTISFFNSSWHWIVFTSTHHRNRKLGWYEITISSQTSNDSLVTTNPSKTSQ